MRPKLRTIRQLVLAGIACLLTALLGDGSARLGADEPKAQKALEGHTHYVLAVAISADGKTLASASHDKTVKLWDLATGKTRATLAGHGAEVITVALSPDGKTLASGGWEDALKVWDVATGKEKATFTGHTKVFTAVFSPDGKTLASAGADHNVRLWDLVAGKEKAVLRGHTDYAVVVAFSPDGKTLVSGSDDHTVKLWDVDTGAERKTVLGHGNWVHAVAISPDGRTVASGSYDGSVKLWEVTTGRQRAALPGNNVVNCLTFSPDGKLLASAGNDKTVKLWVAATGKERAAIPGHTNAVQSVAFSPDGKTLASGSLDQIIKLWDVSEFQPAGKRADLSAKDLDRLWAALAGEDAESAYQAIGTLVEAGAQAVALLKERLRPAPAPNMQRIGSLIADLDNDQFVVRQRAREELLKIGDPAEAALQQRLSEKPSLEVCRQIEQLLNKLPGPETIQGLRGLEALEHIGTAEARQVLETLAKGAEGSRVTQEAKALLQRKPAAAP
jgi:WD domain, G-beta repeat